jgi:hypothetical protein
MKIRKLVLSAIRGNGELKKRIMDELGISQPSMSRFLKDNSEDLTKAAVIKLIREEYKLTDDEILEETISEEAQN